MPACPACGARRTVTSFPTPTSLHPLTAFNFPSTKFSPRPRLAVRHAAPGAAAAAGVRGGGRGSKATRRAVCRHAPAQRRLRIARHQVVHMAPAQAHKPLGRQHLHAACRGVASLRSSKCQKQCSQTPCVMQPACLQSCHLTILSSNKRQPLWCMLGRFLASFKQKQREHMNSNAPQGDWMRSRILAAWAQAECGEPPGCRCRLYASTSPARLAQES